MELILSREVLIVLTLTLTLIFASSIGYGLGLLCKYKKSGKDWTIDIPVIVLVLEMITLWIICLEYFSLAMSLI